MIKHKLIKEQEIKNKIKFYDYGWKNRRNIPSQLNLNKSNLNQNAAQMLCLFQHLPFILYEYRDNEAVKKVWVCMQSLLRVTQIVYSSVIGEDDLKDLDDNTRLHLESIKEVFEARLKPKHHFMTHYSSVIRAMGPIKEMSMFRFEAKHRMLKECLGDSRNFINITKTICERHQQRLACTANIYTDHFNHSKKNKNY